MTDIRHGISIGIERVNNKFFLSLKIVGKLSHQDYEKINPVLDAALEGINEPRINAFVDVSELEGWELRAAGDDFKFGLKHGSEFNKIAVLGNKTWLKFSSKVASWFITGEVRYFEDTNPALVWLQG